MFSFRSGAGGSALPGPLRSLRPNYEDRISLWRCVFLFFFFFQIPNMLLLFSEPRGFLLWALRPETRTPFHPRGEQTSRTAPGHPSGRRLSFSGQGCPSIQGAWARGRASCPSNLCENVFTAFSTADGCGAPGRSAARCPLAQPLFPAGRRSHLFVTWSLRTWKALLGRWEWAADSR